jgi:Pyridoxamine 5'-phosphate oxidase
MSWGELAAQAPAIARVGRRLLEQTGIAFLATVRADGSPRVHPVCPLTLDDELLLGIIDRSPKYRDLRRDPRCVLHALPGPGHTEFWVEAVAEPQTGEALRHWVARDPKAALPAGDTLFRLRLVAAHATAFQPGEGGMPIPDRRHWRAASAAEAAGAVAIAGAVTARGAS